MTLEELKKLADDQELTKDKLFEYYGVKNEDGFDIVFENRMKLDIQGEFLNNSFATIYEGSFPGKTYNPMREKFLFYGFALRGLYNFPIDEFNLIASALGLFATILKIDKIFGNKDEVIYFKQMYDLYLQRTQNISVYIDDAINQLVIFIDEKIKDIEQGNLDKLINTFKEGIGKLQ